MGVQNVPKKLVKRMQQRLMRFLEADRIGMAYVEWELDRVNTVAHLWPKRLPASQPSPAQPLGYDHYRLLGHSVLDALIDQKIKPTNQRKRNPGAVVGRRTDMDANRQQAGTRNARQRVRWPTPAVRQASCTKVHEKKFVVRCECASPHALTTRGIGSCKYRCLTDL